FFAAVLAAAPLPAGFAVFVAFVALVTVLAACFFGDTLAAGFAGERVVFTAADFFAAGFTAGFAAGFAGDFPADRAADFAGVFFNDRPGVAAMFASAPCDLFQR